MRAEGLSRWWLGGIALLLVALGLWAVGGPGAARAERRDEVRQEDLAAINRALACLAEAGRPLPAALGDLDAQGTGCVLPTRLADPYDGAPYGFERLGERSVLLCAGFERPDLVASLDYNGRAFDPATGCHDVALPAPLATST